LSAPLALFDSLLYGTGSSPAAWITIPRRRMSSPANFAGHSLSTLMLNCFGKPTRVHLPLVTSLRGRDGSDMQSWTYPSGVVLRPISEKLRHNKHYLRHHVSLSVRSTFQVIVYSCPFLCDAVEIKVEISHSVTFIRADVARPASL